VIWALRDVSFEVGRGEVLGVIGANGAGKSTLLKVLSRITQPTAGRAVLSGRVGSLLEVGMGFHSELTGRENVYLSGAILGMRKAEIDARFDEIVDFSGVERFLDTPLKRYSSGMRVRLGFAVAAHLEPEILLVDEVLAVGDAAFQQKCLGKMESLEHGGRTIIFVSHNMDAVRHLCTSCLLLQEGRLAAAGAADEVVEGYLRATLAAEPAPAPSATSFEPARPEPAPEAYLTRVEVLDEDGRPSSGPATGQPLRVRIRFRCERAGRYSLYVGIQAIDGAPLIGYGMEHADGRQLWCEPGDHSVELVLPGLPLSAGLYRLGAGISIPLQRWLHRDLRLGTLSVAPRDVLGSGRPLTAEHSILALPHEWIVPEGEQGIDQI